MRRHGFLGLRVFFATVALLIAAPMPSDAGDTKRDRAINGEIWKSDVKYYSDTDTYFQLIDDKATHPNGIDWSEAATAASRMSYKGRNGRLAIIDSPDLQAWVIKTFDFSGRGYDVFPWIGLRYMCSTRVLLKVNGEKYPRAAFSFWNVPWYRTEIRCGKRNIPYMGVYIRGETNRWQAAGVKKRFPHSLVEYPPK